MNPESMSETLQVVQAFEKLNIDYLIGGSFASIMYGEIRTTLDSDLVADLRFEQVTPLIAELGADFYADEEMIKDAIKQRTSFNLIHLESMFKVDVFVLKHRPFDRSQMQRRIALTPGNDPKCLVWFASAEDTILTKLEWYKLGNAISDRQWRDVLGVIKVQGDRLDLVYLETWSVELDVAELLRKALDESRFPK